MRFNLASILKFGFSTAVILFAADGLYLYYEARKKHIAQRPINEVAFVMSNDLPCCRHTESRGTVERCRNPHCKAKLSHKIIEHIKSAKHLICIAM